MATADNKSVTGISDAGSATRPASPRFGRFAVGVTVAGIVLSLVASYWVWSQSVASAEDSVDSAGQLLADSIGSAVEGVAGKLVAVAGLFEASDDVTRAEYVGFVDQLGVDRGVVGMGFAPILTAEEIPGYLVMVRRTVPGYEIHRLDEQGVRQSVRPEGTHVPLQWVHPDDTWDEPYGYDLASVPLLVDTMAESTSRGEVTATSFIRFPGVSGDHIVLMHPVTASTGDTAGYTLALLDVESFLEGRLPGGLAESVDWEVSDTASLPVPTRGFSTTIEVGGEEWQLNATGVREANTVADPAFALFVLLGGIAASVLAGFGASTYRQETAARAEVERLRELGRAKDEFLASVGHELRTPLTGVVGFIELLRDPNQDLDEAERRRMIERVAKESADLAAIIDDLLVAARSEFDLVAVTAERVDLTRVLGSVVESVTKDETSHVAIVGENGGVAATGDPGRIRQIIRNLVVNAMRYGGERVEVRIGRRNGSLTVQVADDGAALSPEESERIFQPYQRLRHLETTPAALGIGLSVSRHLSRLMGGDLTYRNESGWNVFELRLPVAGPGRAGVDHNELIGSAGNQ